MARGEASKVKVHYKGTDEDFLVLVDSVDDYQKWLGDKSVPLAHVVSSFKVFTTHKHGAQGMLEGASRSLLENEFGTSNEDDVLLKILQGGSVQEFEMPQRSANKNEMNGGAGR